MRSLTNPRSSGAGLAELHIALVRRPLGARVRHTCQPFRTRAAREKEPKTEKKDPRQHRNTSLYVNNRSNSIFAPNTLNEPGLFILKLVG